MIVIISRRKAIELTASRFVVFELTTTEPPKF